MKNFGCQGPATSLACRHYVFWVYDISPALCLDDNGILSCGFVALLAGREKS